MLAPVNMNILSAWDILSAYVLQIFHPALEIYFSGLPDFGWNILSASPLLYLKSYVLNLVMPHSQK